MNDVICCSATATAGSQRHSSSCVGSSDSGGSVGSGVEHDAGQVEDVYRTHPTSDDDTEGSTTTHTTTAAEGTATTAAAATADSSTAAAADYQTHDIAADAAARYVACVDWLKYLDCVGHCGHNNNNTVFIQRNFRMADRCTAQEIY